MAENKKLWAAISDEELFSPNFPSPGTEMRLMDDGTIVRRDFGPKVVREFSDLQMAAIRTMLYSTVDDYSADSVSSPSC